MWNALEIYVKRSTNLYGSITSHPSIPSSESWNLARIYEHSLSRTCRKKTPWARLVRIFQNPVVKSWGGLLQKPGSVAMPMPAMEIRIQNEDVLFLGEEVLFQNEDVILREQRTQEQTDNKTKTAKASTFIEAFQNKTFLFQMMMFCFKTKMY